MRTNGRQKRWASVIDVGFPSTVGKRDAERSTKPRQNITETGIQTKRGKIVASFAMGSRRLYDLLDRNPMFSLQPIEVVCQPSVIAAQHRMVSVTQAFSVDLTGQVCVDQLGGEFYSGLMAQPEFLQGASRSVGGKAIMQRFARRQDPLPGSKADIENLMAKGLTREKAIAAAIEAWDLYLTYSVQDTALLRDVWKMNFDPQTNVVDVNIGRLRRKLEEGFASAALETIWGTGYRLLEGR